LNSFLYEKGSGNILLQLSDKIRPFFFALKNNYTLFQFQTALKLKSKYSKRIYEMLSQFKKTGVFKISVQDLKERFELFDPKTGKEEYSNFNLFATKVLEVAKKEINNLTEIDVEYSTEKTGRKITHLHFKITSKKEVVRKLAEPAPEDSEVEKLKDRLVTKFKLSKTLAEKILENISIEKIEAKNKKTWKDYEAGKIDDLGAYCTTIFQNWLDGAEPMLEKLNSPKHIALKPVHQISQDPDLEKENLIRLYGFGLEQKNVYALNVGYSLEELKLAISKVDEALKKQEISHNPEQILQVLREKLKLQKEHSQGSLLASSIPTPMAELLSEEEEKLRQEKNEVWGELIRKFNLSDEEVDSLVEEHHLKDLKVAISELSQAVEAEEIPQESGHMIQLLKKHLNLA
jgi:hypothetical protein